MNIEFIFELKLVLKLWYSKVCDGYEWDCIKVVLLCVKGWIIMMIV